MKDMKKELTPKELNDIQVRKMEFCRRMKSPKRLTENKEGHPYGDTNGYYPWDRFPPGGGNK